MGISVQRSSGGRSARRRGLRFLQYYDRTTSERDQSQPATFQVEQNDLVIKLIHHLVPGKYRRVARRPANKRRLQRDPEFNVPLAITGP